MLLTTEKLSKAYKSRKKGEPVFWAAKEVCVEIPEGKTVGLLGPSGSGKSTVGQMIVGLIEASSGEIFYKGERLSYPLKGELRKKIQILFQHPEVSFNPMLPLIRSMVEPYKLMKKDSSEKAILSDIERFGSLGASLPDTAGAFRRRASSEPSPGAVLVLSRNSSFWTNPPACWT